MKIIITDFRSALLNFSVSSIDQFYVKFWTTIDKMKVPEQAFTCSHESMWISSNLYQQTCTINAMFTDKPHTKMIGYNNFVVINA